MRMAPALLIGLIVAGAALPVAWGARRLDAAREGLDTAAASLDRARSRAQRVEALRASQQRVAERKRPDQDLIARANGVLIAAGIPDKVLGAVRTQSDSSLPGSTDANGPAYRRQTVGLTLRRLDLDQIGRFLGEWAATQELWTPTQINLTRDRGAEFGAVQRDHHGQCDLYWREVNPMRSTRLVLVAMALLLVGGCATTPAGGLYDTPSADSRDTVRAQALCQKAADLITSDPEKAESLLREALGADLFYGPAHNNLGVLYLGQEKLYEAANEFEWARKLMPGHPDPRMNLGLTLEKAGRVDDAIRNYETALEVYPDHLPTLQAFSRCQLRSGRVDDRTPRMLEDVAPARRDR